MGRRASREIAMKLLYQLEIQREDKQDQINEVFMQNELTDKDKEYILDVIDGVVENQSSIDKIIEMYSKGWKINRISRVDLAILRLSIYEVNYRTDIPFNVSVNEAVELAKRYSGEESGAFINGILGKVSKVEVSPSDENHE